MAEITAEQIADALIERSLKPRGQTCSFIVKHGGLDGYDRNEQLAQFMTRLRTSALVAAHENDWPRPAAVIRAEVSIIAYGKRCGPKTLAQIAAFCAKNLYAGPNAVTMGTPTIIKSGTPRLEVTVRAMEIIVPEDAADRAARLAREAPSPAIRADGTYENELRAYETPAFIIDQGVAEVDPLADRLDRMETAAQIPSAEDDADPPSIRNAEDPDAVAPRWHGMLAHKTQGKGGSSNKGPKTKPKTDRRGRYITLTQDDGSRIEHIQGKVSEPVRAIIVEQDESVGQILEDIGQKMIQSGMSFTQLSRVIDSAIAAAGEPEQDVKAGLCP